MRHGIKKRKEKQANIARERIERLFDLAEKSFPRDSEFSHRCVLMAMRIAKRTRTRFPASLKRKFCKYCGSFLVPGKNCTVRTKQGKIVYHCLNCGKSRRMPFAKERLTS